MTKYLCNFNSFISRFCFTSLLLIFLFRVSGQDVCDPGTWQNSTICGSLSAAGVGVIGKNVFCEGDSVPFTIPMTYDIDSAIICWGNGVVMVVYAPGTYYGIYDYANDTCITSTNPTFNTLEININAVLIKNCPLGRSVTKVTNYLSIYFPPRALFTVPSVCTDEMVPINNLSCPNAVTATWLWSAPGAFLSGENTDDPSISYPTPGTYSINLNITTPGAPEGCKESNYSVPIAVGPPATAVCSVPPLVCVGTEVIPVNNSQNAVAPPGQSAFFWNQISGPSNGMMFIAPYLPTDKEPHFKFVAPGTYQIRLSVKGCHNPDTVVTIVVRDKPSAVLTLPNNQCASYSFTISATNCPVNTGGFPEAQMTYSWLITRPDGTTLSYNTKYPTVPIMCDIPGVYSFVFMASNGCAPAFSLTQTMTVNARPAALFSYILPTDSCIGTAPLTIQFVNQSTGTNITPAWSIVGPGATINASSGHATFNQPGTFTVTLKVSNSCPSPNSDIKSVTFILYASPKITNFTLPPTCENNNLELTNANFAFSDGNLPCNCTWSFENSTTSTVILPCSVLPSPVTFLGAGPHKVSVKITNKCGDDYKELTLTLGQKPTPNFSLNLPVTLCAPLGFTCTNTSASNSNGAVTYSWELIDANGTPISVSNAVNPSFNVSVAGNYTIRLKATNSCGSAETAQSFMVFGRPTGTLVVSGGACGAGSPFLELSVQSEGGSALLPPQWQFGDGTPPSGTGFMPNPPSYTQYGTYPIVVTLDNGFCQTTLTQNFTVTAIPESNVSLADRPRCLPANGHLLNFILAPKPNVVYEWTIRRKSQPADPFVVWKTFNVANPTQLVSECGIYAYDLKAYNTCDTVYWSAIDTFYTRPSAVLPVFTGAYCQQISLNFNGPDFNIGCNPNLQFWWEFPGATPMVSYDMHPQDILFSSPNAPQVFTYFLHLIDCDGDTITYSGTVHIDAPQVLTLGPTPLTLCENAAPVPLIANIPGGKWYLNGLEVVDGKVHPENLSPGLYMYHYKKTSGSCITEGTLEVTILPVPTLEVGANIVVCLGDGYVIRSPQIAPGNTGVWTSSNPGLMISGDTIRFLYALNTTLKYTVTDAITACTNVQSITISVLDNALTPAPPSVFSLCNNPEAVPLPLTNVHNALRYYGLGVLPDSLHFDPSLIPIGQNNVTVYWVHVNSAGCSIEGNTIINVESLLLPGELSAGPNAEICQNANQPFVYEGLPLGNMNLKWLDKNGTPFSLTGSISINPNTFQKDTVLMLILAHRHGTLNCAQYDTTYLHIRYAAPDAGVAQTACLNDGIQPLLPGNQPPTGYNAYWTDTNGAIITDFLTELLGVGSQLFLYHFEGFGCHFIKEKNVEIYPLPGTHFSVSGATCANQPFSFINDTPLGVSWAWFADGQLFSTAKTPLNQVFPPGYHTIKLISHSIHNCESEYEATFFVESPPTLTATLDKTEGCGPVLLVNATYTVTAADTLLFVVQAPGVNTYTIGASGNGQTLALTDGLFDLEYTITLLAINECDTARMTFKVVVFAAAYGEFSIHKDTFCSGEINYALSNTFNSIGDTLEILVQNQVVHKWVLGNGLLVPFQLFTQVPLLAEVCLGATGKCNKFSTCRDILVVPNEFKALIEVNFPDKVCAGTVIPLIGHVTTGATAEWRDQWGNVQFGDTIWVTVALGLNQWTLYAFGCGYDSMMVSFTGISPLPIQATFAPVACLGQETSFEFLSPGSFMYTVFSPADSVVGNTPEHIFSGSPGKQWFKVVARSPEGCLLTLDTFILVQIPPHIGLEKEKNCTQELGVTLIVEDPDDIYYMKLLPTNDDWTEGNVFNTLQPGLYTLWVSDGICASDTVVGIDSIEEIVAKVVPGDTLINLGETITLYGFSNLSDANFNWSPISQLSNPVERITQVAPFKSTTYVLTIEKNGCQDTASVRVEINPDKKIYIPNVFSAVDETQYSSENSKCRIYGNRSLTLVKRFAIYDRWGNLVFERNNYDPHSDVFWDGTHDSKNAPAGVYAWVADVLFFDGAILTFQGDVTLVR